MTFPTSVRRLSRKELSLATSSFRARTSCMVSSSGGRGWGLAHSKLGRAQTTRAAPLFPQISTRPRGGRRQAEGDRPFRREVAALEGREAQLGGLAQRAGLQVRARERRLGD